MIEQKSPSNSRKTTNCSQCTRHFWYIDPRPGGRPRQKCGICSSRPPRYPWGFLDGEPNEFGVTSDISYAPEAKRKSSTPHKRTRGGSHTPENRQPLTDDAADNPYPLPSPYSSAAVSATSAADDERLTRIEKTLDRVEARLDAMEARMDQAGVGSVPRSDWVDLCARLDIVEHITAETLGQVRSKLDVFAQNVKHIAVVPERELNEMFEMVRHIRLELMPDSGGNR